MFDERDDILQKIVDQHHSHPSNKSLLILDQTKDEYTHKFFEKSADYVILDAKNLHRKRFIRKTSMNVLLDECRHLVVYATLRGKTLVIRFGELAVDFNNTFADEACPELPQYNPAPPYQPWKFLPRGFLFNNGQLLRGNAPYPHCVLRRDDVREVKEYLLKKREHTLHESQDEDKDEDDDMEEAGKRWQVLTNASLNIPDLTPLEVIQPSFRIILTTTIKPENIKDLLFNGRFGLPTTSLNDFIIQEFIY
eukprot:gene6039-6492_t